MNLNLNHMWVNIVRNFDFYNFLENNCKNQGFVCLIPNLLDFYYFCLPIDALPYIVFVQDMNLLMICLYACPRILDLFFKR